MKLKDLANMEKYLQEDCYCPGEIYDMYGIFCMIFNAEEECKFIAKGKLNYSKNTTTCVLCRNQLITFWINSNNEIVNAEIYDATKNNIKQIKDLLNGKIDRIEFDEFNDEQSAKNIEEIMQYADAIMMS